MIRALARLLPYVLRVRRSFVIGLACILAATALSLASPWVLKYVVDGLTEGVDRVRLVGYAGAILATVSRRRRVPLPDAHLPYRRISSDGI